MHSWGQTAPNQSPACLSPLDQHYPRTNPRTRASHGPSLCTYPITGTGALPREDDDKPGPVRRPDALLGPNSTESVTSMLVSLPGSTDSLGSFAAAAAQQKLSSAEQTRRLLEKFVDLEHPVITDKMARFIMDPGVCVCVCVGSSVSLSRTSCARGSP